MKSRLLIFILVVLFICFPVLIVHLIPTTNPEPYIFNASVIEKLGDSLQGKLSYYLVEEIEGVTPADRFAVLIDSAYTRGYRPELKVNEQVWMQGILMTKAVFFGENYLFFSYRQLYISQIKTGILWPDQVTRLRILYTSPLTSFRSLVLIFRYPFMEEFSPRNYITMIVQGILIIVTIVLLVKRRYTGKMLFTLLLIYGIVMILTSIPLLNDLY